MNEKYLYHYRPLRESVKLLEENGKKL